MRPDIKRMNERLGYFLHEMDLANAHVDHAEREIERLEKELHDTKGENGLLFARNIELERATREFPCDARISELNAEIQELKKNLDFFKKEAAKLEGLYWELDELRSNSEEQSRIIKDLGEKNFWLNQTLNAENDRLERNDELTKENARLMLEVDKLKRENGRLEVSLKWAKEGYEAIKEDKEKLEIKLASKEKLLTCKLSPVPTCKCGQLAGYNVLGTYYCPECVTKVIKL